MFNWEIHANFFSTRPTSRFLFHLSTHPRLPQVVNFYLSISIIIISQLYRANKREENFYLIFRFCFYHLHCSGNYDLVVVGEASVERGKRNTHDDEIEAKAYWPRRDQKCVTAHPPATLIKLATDLTKLHDYHFIWNATKMSNNWNPKNKKHN